MKTMVKNLRNQITMMTKEQLGEEQEEQTGEKATTNTTF
jgi:hypothetical protein